MKGTEIPTKSKVGFQHWIYCQKRERVYPSFSQRPKHIVEPSGHRKCFMLLWRPWDHFSQIDLLSNGIQINYRDTEAPYRLISSFLSLSCLLSVYPFLLDSDNTLICLRKGFRANTERSSTRRWLIMKKRIMEAFYPRNSPTAHFSPFASPAGRLQSRKSPLESLVLYKFLHPLATFAQLAISLVYSPARKIACIKAFFLDWKLFTG